PLPHRPLPFPARPTALVGPAHGVACRRRSFKCDPESLGRYSAPGRVSADGRPQRLGDLLRRARPLPTSPIWNSSATPGGDGGRVGARRDQITHQGRLLPGAGLPFGRNAGSQDENAQCQSKGTWSPSLIRVVQFAVAIVSASSMICSSLNWALSASRSASSIFSGRVVRRSVYRKMACSSGVKRPAWLLPPGSFTALICSSVNPYRLPEAVCERVQKPQPSRIETRR